ncbi:glucose dehydrogenase [FAD, quinone]-like [Mercenaria mercenaria]|uniref:glucose dehydrogenase [FAD, quinone]-like n=1 Tax=Mercenaria mercenaria TaxID=6596 RepID=UPI00234EA617|nr:glucose dehydrogenase [FAD, quinone]-like [Mercenaria mercenaria]
MRYMTGEELRKTLGWWLVLSVFAAGVGLTYMRTLDSSPFGYITVKTNATYDYVIVGGGTSGSVLASRLSDDPRLTVLLLEAGGEESIDMWNHVPLWNPIQHGSQADWGYLTTPQKHACKAAKGQKCALPQAKILGGSSLNNNMLYSRGSPHDFTTWPSDTSKTWSWKNILPYFLKSEDMFDEDMKLSDYHSTNGPLPVSGPASEVSDLHQMFLSSARELKHKTIDCNGRESVGFCRLSTTVKDGERFSTSKDFLRPTMHRKNLHVTTHAIAIKVLISKNKAVGVEYVRNGQKRTVGANKEVILAGGAIGSAQLLMLSGVGPKDQLTKLKIPVIADLPVGSNLQEHVVYKMDIQTNESVGVTREMVFNAVSYLQYLALGKGWLATSAGIFGNAQLKMDSASKLKVADVQLSFSAISKNLAEEKKEEPKTKTHSSTPQSNATTVANGFTITVELLHPDSRGRVRLDSNNPFVPPLIDPSYLSNQKDIQTLIKAIKVAQSFLSTSSFRAIKARLFDKPYSPCIQHKIKSDAYWECVLRHQAVGNGQLTSTCSMGSAGSERAIVDTSLRVRNITSLRVVDASVMPSSVSGDITATKIMIAEKAADLIRGHESVRFYRRLSERVLAST